MTIARCRICGREFEVDLRPDQMHPAIRDMCIYCIRDEGIRRAELAEKGEQPQQTQQPVTVAPGPKKIEWFT